MTLAIAHTLVTKLLYLERDKERSLMLATQCRQQFCDPTWRIDLARSRLLTVSRSKSFCLLSPNSQLQLIAVIDQSIIEGGCTIVEQWLLGWLSLSFLSFWSVEQLLEQVRRSTSSRYPNMFWCFLIVHNKLSYHFIFIRIDSKRVSPKIDNLQRMKTWWHCLVAS
jgi:hypothetical protein